MRFSAPLACGSVNDFMLMDRRGSVAECEDAPQNAFPDLLKRFCILVFLHFGNITSAGAVDLEFEI